VSDILVENQTEYINVYALLSTLHANIGNKWYRMLLGFLRALTRSQFDSTAYAVVSIILLIGGLSSIVICGIDRQQRISSSRVGNRGPRGHTFQKARLVTMFDSSYLWKQLAGWNIE
jgi:hypothetical protein